MPAAGKDVVDLAGALRSRGLRVTPQRAQVLETVRRLGHATPEAISADVDGVDVTTVYRALQVLEEIGLVTHAHLGHGAPSYQLSADGHLHVVCHSCGRVIQSPAGLADAIAARLLADRHFTVDLAHLTIFGQCAECVRTGAAAASHGHSHGEAAADTVERGSREQTGTPRR